jgi:hypothetical protein
MVSISTPIPRKVWAYALNLGPGVSIGVQPFDPAAINASRNQRGRPCTSIRFLDPSEF